MKIFSVENVKMLNKWLLTMKEGKMEPSQIERILYVYQNHMLSCGAYLIEYFLNCIYNRINVDISISFLIPTSLKYKLRLSKILGINPLKNPLEIERNTVRLSKKYIRYILRIAPIIKHLHKHNLIDIDIPEYEGFSNPSHNYVFGINNGVFYIRDWDVYGLINVMNISRYLMYQNYITYFYYFFTQIFSE